MATAILCICGRKRAPQHCTSCGTTSLYARLRSGRHEVIDGVPTYIRGYRCRRCGQDFAADSACGAPPLTQDESLKLMAKIAKDSPKIPFDFIASIKAHGGDRKAAIADLFKATGNKRLLSPAERDEPTGVPVSTDVVPVPPSRQDGDWHETNPLFTRPEEDSKD